MRALEPGFGCPRFHVAAAVQAHAVRQPVAGLAKSQPLAVYVLGYLGILRQGIYIIRDDLAQIRLHFLEQAAAGRAVSHGG